MVYSKKFLFLFEMLFFILFFKVNLNSELPTFSDQQLRQRAELAQVSKNIDAINAQIKKKLLDGATYEGKRKIDKELQNLDSEYKSLLAVERKLTSDVVDQYVAVSNDLEELKYQAFIIKRDIMLGNNIQLQNQYDDLNLKIAEEEKIANILYPEKARREQSSELQTK